jgi:outer membrane protein OmpA-like peptidoglycan-associated protein
MRRAFAAAAVAMLAAPSVASADRWLAAELPAAWAVSQPQANTFRAGALPALGLYQPVAPWLAVALRGRAGLLRDGQTPMNGLRDPGQGGLATLSAAVRLTGPRYWLEVAGGGGVTGDDWIPAAEVGVGWAFALGPVEGGPSFRYLHVVAPEGFSLGSAHLALFGIELRGRTARPAARMEPAVAAPRDDDRLVDRAAMCADEPEGCPRAASVDADRDTLVEVLESCRALAGDAGGEGCADDGSIQVEADRVILADHVLFDTGRARVRSGARPIIRAIAHVWRERNWQAMVVEGHADVRGDPKFNLWLSQQRAERTRAVLIEAGVPADAVTAIGHGATRPRSPDQHDVNRRVEFVVLPRVKPTEVTP